MTKTNKFPLQVILEQLYYSITSIPLSVQLTLNAIDNEVDIVKNILKINQDHFSEIMTEIIKKYKPKNPLNNEESEESRRLIKEELEKRLFFKVLSDEHFQLNLDEKLDKLEQLLYARKATLNNGVVSLITHYEIFLSEIIRFHLSVNPVKINPEISTPFSRIMQVNSIQTLIDDVISYEVERIMVCNPKDMHKELFKLGYSDKYFKNKSNQIYELFARRNAIIHNNAFVNQQYLKAGNIYSFKKSEEIVTDLDYLKETVAIMMTHALYIVNYEWDKYSLSVEEEIHKNMNNAIERIAFLKLSNFEWENTFYIYESLKNTKKNLDNVEAFTLNYMLSGKYYCAEKVSEEISHYNYKSRGKFYQLGYLGMICEYNKMIDIYNSDKSNDLRIFSHDYLSWPIFKELREKDKDKFNELIKCVDEYRNKNIKLENEF